MPRPWTKTEHKLLVTLATWPSYGINTDCMREWSAAMRLRDRGAVAIKGHGIQRDTHKGYTKSWVEATVFLLAGRTVGKDGL